MTSTAVLAQSDSVANWVAAIGQVLGAIGTFAAVVVALRLAQRDRRRIEAERRDREAAQARLVTITVARKPYPDPYDIGVEITNHSEQPVHQPCLESMGAPRPPVAYSGGQVAEVLAPHAKHVVRFDYSARVIEKRVTADEVKITFTDAAGLRWSRTGNGEPVRVVQPAPAGPTQTGTDLPRLPRDAKGSSQDDEGLHPDSQEDDK